MGEGTLQTKLEALKELRLIERIERIEAIDNAQGEQLDELAKKIDALERSDLVTEARRHGLNLAGGGGGAAVIIALYELLATLGYL